MRQILPLIATLIVLTSVPDAHAAPQEPSSRADSRFVVYGNDDRHEVCDETDAATLRAAAATVALIEMKNLRVLPTGDFSIKSVSYRREFNLCSSERFVDQDLAAVCTGFLVAPDIVATAGHCIQDQSDCEKHGFVFDYKYDAPNRPPREASAKQVYKCKSLIFRKHDPSGDFGLVRLDRPVTDREPVRVRQSGTPQKGDGLFVVGHPSGLPMKIAGGAFVRSVGHHTFRANLDTYSGNSGSPVFNERTHEVEGILVSGDQDFEKRGICNVTHHCKDNGCGGEEAMFVTHILPYLK